MTRSEGKRSRYWALQTVHSESPSISSPANLVLLSRKYFNLDNTIYSDYRMSQIRIAWMTEQMKTKDSKGGLTCKHCGREGLNPWTENIKEMAVLDHIQEICNRGSWRDPSNFQVLCDRCNQKKSDGRIKNLTSQQPVVCCQE